MAQHDYDIANQTFPSFRSDLNSVLEAINTSNSGTSRPTSAVAGTIWLDTTNATNPTLKLYDGADDISLATFDYSANTVNWIDSTVIFDIVNDTTPQLGGNLDVNGNSLVSTSNGNITFTPDGTGKVVISGLSFPTADGTCGQAIVTDGCGNLSFASVEGRTGTVNWDTTAKTTNFTAVNGNGYFVNTTSGAITVTLPAGSAGDIISLADYAATWQTNNVTVTPNGTDKIGGVNEDAILSTEGQSVTFVYTDSTQGWLNTMDSTSNVRGNAFIEATGGTITTCGNCKIHTFTGPGTFCVSQVNPCAANNRVSYMVVAGGGSGGGGYQSAGGGAGGFREDKSPVTPYTASPLDGAGPITVTATSYPITVGGGGSPVSAPSPAVGVRGNSGSNSIFSTITSTGGGGGGSFSCGIPSILNGLPGGSGGGAGRYNGSAPGGTGNTPPVSPSQGFRGGDSGTPYTNPFSGAGGGGATAAGACVQSSFVGTGGDGATTSISGSSTSYSGGGGGGGYKSPSVCSTAPDSGDGGLGGGGKGGYGPTAAVSGTTNTGGGGGGGSGPFAPLCGAGGAGGSGIVVIRYKFQ